MQPADTPTAMLPSIHEMFPEHLMQAPQNPSSSRPYHRQAVAFRVTSHTSDKSNTPQASVANDLDRDQRAYYGVFHLPPYDGNDDGISGNGADKGMFVCPTCWKRFNRPSSLRTHINTHTGVTPFRCPWPNCGRGFNVNSNMRRHYRNHNDPRYRSRLSSNLGTDNSYPNGGGNDGSRRHTRMRHPLVQEPAPSLPARASEFIPYITPYSIPPASNLSASDYSDEDGSERMEISHDGKEEAAPPLAPPAKENSKAREKEQTRETTERTSSSPWFFELTDFPPWRLQPSPLNHTYAALRSLPLTQSPSPPSTHVYNASTPYVRSF